MEYMQETTSKFSKEKPIEMVVTYRHNTQL